MSISQFYYIGNKQNLFFGVFSLSLIGYIFYTVGLPNVDITFWSVVGYSFYVTFMLLFAWLAYFSFKTYFKLRGHKRVITISDSSITFPELGNSLKIIELKFSEITDIYFAEGRHGIPSNLIIKYGDGGHAYIAKDYLKFEDFEAICSFFKKALKIKQISVK
ncbi:hypothetical protein [Pseudoalteromonas sp. OANN1]|uniref:hypothetical protein n=1 Tax=Pseudoalteromonas sp. OANN1 TaxID=2954497 RepID=UPI0020980B8E|nr:hypothetical protein [Pseudoalteromonas sp. OANN1]MCO7201601.1 hypothetical protein [Pseudoalteromonas sp. OANN1]